MRRALPFVLTFAVAACGFHLRGEQKLPFGTLYVPVGSPLSTELKRNLAAQASSTQVVTDPKEAEAVLGFTSETREKVILSFDTAGRVREYQLRYTVGFRLTDAKGQVYVPTSEIRLTRDISYSDAQVLAKESEEAQLYRDMQSDMVQQLLRRIAAAKTAKPALD
jgi:LPS-assembly lipoprotein